MSEHDWLCERNGGLDSCDCEVRAIIALFPGGIEEATAAKDVAVAAICWWEEHRPLMFDEAEHLKQPAVNACETHSSEHLARSVAEYVNILHAKIEKEGT